MYTWLIPEDTTCPLSNVLWYPGNVILNVVCKPSNSSNNQVSLVWWGSCQCPLWLHHPKRTPAPCWTVYPKMCSQHQPPQLEGKHIIHTLFVDGPLTITAILRGCQYASHASKGTQWRSTATGMLFTTTILSQAVGGWLGQKKSDL